MKSATLVKSDARTSLMWYLEVIRIYLGYGYPCSLTVKCLYIVFKNSMCTGAFPKVPPICLC